MMSYEYDPVTLKVWSQISQPVLHTFLSFHGNNYILIVSICQQENNLSSCKSIDVKINFRNVM